MAVTYALFLQRFPELSTVKEAEYDGAYSGASVLIKTEIYDSKADEALLLLTAHYVILGQRKGKAGTITSEKVGDLSRTFDSNEAEDLHSTSYGQAFLSLRKRVHKVPFLII
jgi:hypothetical protein